MSQYFSRLAQRSGVSDASASTTPSAPAVQNASLPGVDSLSETTTETVALGAPSRGSDWLPDAADFAPPAPLNSSAAGTVAASSTDAASDGVQFLAHVRAVTEQWRSNAEPDAFPVASSIERRSVDAADVSTRERVGAKPLPSEAGVALPAVGSVAVYETDDLQASAAMANNPARSPPSTVVSSVISATPVRADALPPQREHVSDRISAHSPPAPASADAQRPSPAAASLQVHIGRIELEVHAPAALPAPPTPAAAPASPAPTRDPGFNRHRHYLRGR